MSDKDSEVGSNESPAQNGSQAHEGAPATSAKVQQAKPSAGAPTKKRRRVAAVPTPAVGDKATGAVPGKPATKAKTKAQGKTQAQSKAKAKAQAKAQAKAEAAAKKERSKKARQKTPFSVRLFFARLVPVLCVAVAFVGLCAVFRVAFPPVTTKADGSTTGSESPVVQGDAAVQSRPSNVGVEDRWVTSGYFTTGDKNLDAKVKQFCDALTVEGSNASSNALEVYNNIMWNYSIVDRGEKAKPAGPNWDTACARDFFSRYDAAAGLGGEADYYELAAVVACCLRYFGYSDALAVPVVIDSGGESTVDAAYCLVTDENGAARICDPTMGAAGWMTDRYSHKFMVDDIGQDLTQVEAMGLQIMRSSDSTSNDATSTDGQSSTTQQQTEESQTQTDLNEEELQEGYQEGYSPTTFF
ncbi:MAG: hypothetical protein Q4A01_05395 [Coriobacteriales bacterium]|nr:hypothetical protein [Coriobacteriales bacterium]